MEKYPENGEDSSRIEWQLAASLYNNLVRQVGQSTLDKLARIMERVPPVKRSGSKIDLHPLDDI